MNEDWRRGEWPEELGDPATVHERFHLRVELTQSAAGRLGPALFAETVEAVANGASTVQVMDLVRRVTPAAKRELVPGAGPPEFVVVHDVTGDWVGTWREWPAGDDGKEQS